MRKLLITISWHSLLEEQVLIFLFNNGKGALAFNIFVNSTFKMHNVQS